MGERTWNDANLRKNTPDGAGLLDGQVVENDYRPRVCPIWQNVMAANHQFVRFVGQTQVPWATQFGVIATAVAATTDEMAFVPLCDLLSLLLLSILVIEVVGGENRWCRW